MGEAIISRRGRGEISTTYKTFSDLAFRGSGEPENTGVSVSDMINPEINRNVFVIITSFQFNSAFGGVNYNTVFSASIINNYVYIDLDIESSGGEINNVSGCVYKAI